MCSERVVWLPPILWMPIAVASSNSISKASKNSCSQESSRFIHMVIKSSTDSVVERSAVNVDQRIPSFHSHSRNWSFMNVAVPPLFLSPLLRKPFLDSQATKSHGVGIKSTNSICCKKPRMESHPGERNKSIGPKFVCFNAGQPERLPFFLASFRASMF